MHLSALFTVLSALVASVVASPVAGPEVETPTITTTVAERGLEIPATAGGYKARRGGAETNAQRMQRGLNPSRPRKLYARADDLAKRVLVPPAEGKDPRPSYAATADTYTVYGSCYASSYSTSHLTPFPLLCLLSADYAGPVTPSGPTYTLDFTGLQDLADQCAAKQDLRADGGDSTGAFFITVDTTRLNGINCVTSVYPSGASGVCAGLRDNSNFDYIFYSND